MVNLNDVLLAMSNIPVDDPIAEIWGRGLQGGDKIIKYTGALPITINADGNALLDYRIYGADGGVGEQTENLFDLANSEMNCYYDASGTKQNNNYHNTSDYIPVESGKTYTLSLTRVALGFGMYLNLWDDGKQFVTNLLSLVSPDGSYSFSSPINGYIRFNWVPGYTNNVMLTKGSTPPTSYIPYGYKLPMVTRSRNLLYPIETEQIIPLKPNTVYVASRYKFGRIDVSIYDENDELIWNNYMQVWVSMKFGNFANQKYAKITTTPSLVNHASVVEGDEEFVNTSTFCPSTYIPYSRTDTPIYIGDTQLDAIGDYADYVDYDKQKIVRQIVEYTFTGNETFIAYGVGFYTNKIFSDAVNAGDRITTRFSHFTSRTNTTLDDMGSVNFGDNRGCFRANIGNVMLRSTANFTTVEECNAYFKAQYDNGTPVKISYWLKTPIEEDPPVPLPEIPTINGETIIDYDGTPKPSQMYVKYKGKG